MDAKEYRKRLKEIEALAYRNVDKDFLYFDKLEKELMDLIEIAPEGDIEARVVLAKVQYIRGNYKQAEKTYVILLNYTDQKRQLCLNGLLKCLLMRKKYENAFDCLEALEEQLDKNQVKYDYKIIYLLLCYLNDYAAEEEVSIDLYMTTPITNQELLIAYDNLLDYVAQYKFTEALEMCDKCIEISKREKTNCEFKTLKRLLYLCVQKSLATENKTILDNNQKLKYSKNN